MVQEEFVAVRRVVSVLPDGAAPFARSIPVSLFRSHMWRTDVPSPSVSAHIEWRSVGGRVSSGTWLVTSRRIPELAPKEPSTVTPHTGMFTFKIIPKNATHSAPPSARLSGSSIFWLEVSKGSVWEPIETGSGVQLGAERAARILITDIILGSLETRGWTAAYLVKI